MEFAVFLQQHPVVFVLLTGMFGAFVGSFLNVVVYRLPKMELHDLREDCHYYFQCPAPEEPPPTLWGPRSMCPHCGRIIAAYHNIPVISWFLLRGKCAYCQTPFSIRYPLVETLTAVMFAVVAARFGWSWQCSCALLLTSALIALTFIDIDHQLLPDKITLPLMWCGILMAFIPVFTGLESAVTGAVAGYLSLWSFYHLYRLLTKKEGMGYGDFKLLAAAGAWFGWVALPIVILLSSLAGAVIGIILLRVGNKDWSTRIPFGPYIAIAMWAYMIWGDWLLKVSGWDKLLVI